MVSQYPVLTHDGYDVGRNAYRTKVQQGYELAELYSIVVGECLHQLEAHSTTAKMLVRIRIVLPLGVQHGNGLGQFAVGDMMVANDEIYALLVGVIHFPDCLDTTIEHYDQLDSCPIGIVYTVECHAIPLVVTIRHVIVNV